jgi:hypothetical protein
MSYNAQAQIMMAGWEMTLSMPSLTQTWKDPAAAMTTRRSGVNFELRHDNFYILVLLRYL